MSGNVRAWPASAWLCACAVLPAAILALNPDDGPGRYYVDSVTGDDGGSGLTPATAWRSLEHAADAMPAGSECTVAAGTYPRIRITRSGSLGAPLTFKAAGPGVVVNGVTVEGAMYVVIDGFEVTIPRQPSLDEWDVGSGVSLIDAQYCQVRNCYVHHTLREGIMLFSRAGESNAACGYNRIGNNRIAYAGGYAGITLNGVGHLIEGNDISHTVQHPLFPTLSTADGADADGIQFFGKDHVIRGNRIHDITLSDAGNVDPHIDAFQTYGPASNIVIERNEIDLPAEEGVSQAAMISQAFTPVSDLVIRHNVVTAFRGFNIWGVDDWTDTPKPLHRVTLVNNTFYGVKDYDVELHDTPESVVKNNLFSASGRYIHIDSEAVATERNGAPEPLVVRDRDVPIPDPEFVRPAERDFHPRPASPLIDAGATVPPTGDFDGTPVPQGAAPDIGAFEYKVGTTTDTPFLRGCSLQSQKP